MSADAERPPIVSVVLPTYQRQRQVRRAVGSVLSQTFQDFELTVLDDGSTDGTAEALADVRGLLTYARQENAGVAAARNAGVRQARGRIVAFLDSDDLWLPDHLAVVTGVLARFPEAVLATTCPRFRVAGREDPSDARLLDLRERVLAYGDTVGFSACVAVRREALITAGCFDEEIRAGEDTDLWTRLGALGPIATVHRRTVICRVSQVSLRDPEQARRRLSRERGEGGGEPGRHGQAPASVRTRAAGGSGEGCRPSRAGDPRARPRRCRGDQSRA